MEFGEHKQKSDTSGNAPSTIGPTFAEEPLRTVIWPRQYTPPIPSLKHAGATSPELTLMVAPRTSGFHTADEAGISPTPLAPEAPVDPVDPGTPDDPCSPEGPVTPAPPEAPSGPEAPVNPVAPDEPV